MFGVTARTSRCRRACVARQMAYYLLVHRYGWTLRQVGRAVARHHTTVHQAVNAYRRQRLKRWPASGPRLADLEHQVVLSMGMYA